MKLLKHRSDLSSHIGNVEAVAGWAPVILQQHSSNTLKVVVASTKADFRGISRYHQAVATFAILVSFYNAR